MSTEPMPKCPECGELLPPNAPGGLCPNCLMALNLRTETTLAGDQAQTQPPLSPDQIAPHFPQLEILEYLGRGGMGVVYKARQKTLNRVVALKLLAPERVNDPKFAGRFTREAQALAALNHPNIVTIYDFGQAGGFYYLLMEFVDGLNLRHLLRARKFTPEEALAIIPPLCDALQFAHERGIVHRDIKPENILLDKMGRVKVADFGIAKMLGNGQETEGGGPAVAAGVTQSVVGTPGYSAPEQSSDPKRVDSRADIYSLGVVFYEMLTGELPGKKIEPPSKKVQIDVRLDEVVLRALEKEPELRYQQASVFKTRIETILSEPGNPAATAWHGSWQQFEYKSTRTLFGLPLLHVAMGVDPQTGRAKIARGFFAIGGRAHGVVAFGGMATGVFAFGGLAVGMVAYGGGAFGLVSYGGLAIALLLAVGGGAIAPVALGGGAIGYFAFGGKGFGAHVLDSMTEDPAAHRFFFPWAKHLLLDAQGFNLLFLAFVLLVALGVPTWMYHLSRKQSPPGPQPGDKPGPADPGARKPVAVLGWRDRWMWDTGYTTMMFFVPCIISANLVFPLYRWFGAIGLLSLLPGFLGLLFAITYGVVGRKIRKLKAQLPASDAEMAEALIFERPRQTPGVALLHTDRLELYGIALIDRLVIPLANIAAISEVTWFNGTRLWWKHGFVLDLKDGRRIGLAVPELFGRRWRAKLSGGSLPELPEINKSGLNRELLESHSPRYATEQRALNQAEWSNPSNRSFGFYFSKRDSRVIVPRQSGFGWTVNAGHWQGAAVIFGIILLPVLLLAFIYSERSSTSPRFGPVVERVVNYSGPGSTNCELDLDSGRLFTHPADGGGWNWYLTNGIDLFGDPTDPGAHRVWAAGGTVISRIDSDAWDKLNAKVLPRLLAGVPQDMRAGTPVDDLGDVPGTFAFKTREGGMGLLQMTGHSKDSAGVKIHYKLLRNETVEVSRDEVVVKAPDFHGEGMLILFGPTTNRWEAWHLDSLFAVTFKGHFLGHGVDWTIKRAYGNMGYRLENATTTNKGIIAFREGKPAPEGDGSYVIGEFQPDGSSPIPISVRLAQSDANSNFVSNSPARPPINENRRTNAPRPNTEVLRVQIRQAQAEVSNQIVLFSNGRALMSDLEAAQDNLAILNAELDGDNLKVAQIRVASAQRAVDSVSVMFNIGTVPVSELEKAKAELEIRQAELRSLQPPIETNADFGPVIDRLITIGGGAGGQSFYSIEKGAYVAAPKDLPSFPAFEDETDLANSTRARYAAWLASNNVDCLVWNTTPEPALVLSGMKVRAVLMEHFNDPVGEVTKMVEADSRTNDPSNLLPLQSNMDSRGGPITAIFQTRNGSIGILQVMGHTENPRGVRIRYKLVRSASK